MIGSGIYGIFDRKRDHAGHAQQVDLAQQRGVLGDLFEDGVGRLGRDCRTCRACHSGKCTLLSIGQRVNRTHIRIIAQALDPSRTVFGGVDGIRLAALLGIAGQLHIRQRIADSAGTNLTQQCGAGLRTLLELTTLGDQVVHLVVQRLEVCAVLIHLGADLRQTRLDLTQAIACGRGCKKL